MSHPIGSELPDTLFGRLAGPVGDRPFLAVVVVTTDPAGWPHPALLSYGEVLALDLRRIRVAVAEASRTAANLRRSGRITFGFIEAGTVYYVKATVRAEVRLGDRADLVGFEAAIETVLHDVPHPDEGGGAVVDGIRFAPRNSPEHLRHEWGAMLAHLRATG